jgi:hypothetical protein
MVDDVERKAKGSKLKTYIIIGLGILIIAMLYSNTVDESTKGKLWTALVILGVVGGIIYFFFFKKKSIDVIDIARKILYLEYTNFGRRINLADVTIDELDAETLLFGWESAGHLVAYKWNIPKNALMGRIFKKADAVKDEVNRREIMRNMAAKSLARTEERKAAAKEGFEVEFKEENHDE